MGHEFPSATQISSILFHQPFLVSYTDCVSWDSVSGWLSFFASAVTCWVDEGPWNRESYCSSTSSRACSSTKSHWHGWYLAMVSCDWSNNLYHSLDCYWELLEMKIKLGLYQDVVEIPHFFYVWLVVCGTWPSIFYFLENTYVNESLASAWRMRSSQLCLGIAHSVKKGTEKAAVTGVDVLSQF